MIVYLVYMDDTLMYITKDEETTEYYFNKIVEETKELLPEPFIYCIPMEVK